jgi:SAM-dependent methyltransferase
VTDYARIYAAEAEAYDRMVRAEDCDGELARALAAYVVRGTRALEVGVGTGRVTGILCDLGASVVGCEPAPAMLAVARARLAAYADRVQLIEGTCATLAPEAAAYDLAIAGWVFGHLRTWRAPAWREAIGAELDRMQAAVRPGGAMILVETLGTGTASAAPPNPSLAEYYAWLEGERGFTRTVIRTDYAFANAEEAASAMGFFFGDELAARVRASGSGRVPEHTGVWVYRR